VTPPTVHRGDRLLIEDLSAELLDPSAGQGMLPDNRPSPQTVQRQIILHDGVCSGAWSGASVYDVLRWHRERRGWPHIGCHYFIPTAPEVRDGRLVVAQTLSPNYIGLGTMPNHGRLHVACAGEVPTGPQREALKLLLKYLLDTYPLRPHHITPHREIYDRRNQPDHLRLSCPGEPLSRLVHWLQDTRDPFRRRLASG
jgi:hypothetical protein